MVVIQGRHSSPRHMIMAEELTMESRYLVFNLYMVERQRIN
jgi:hypothetical protein